MDVADGDAASPPVLAAPSPYDSVEELASHGAMHWLRLPERLTVLWLWSARDGYTYVNTAVLGAGDADAYVGGGFGAVPASGVAIAALPETTAGGGGEAECAVCMEGYEAGDALRNMPCAHAFHERCIFDWLRVSRLCPLCRFALPADDGSY